MKYCVDYVTGCLVLKRNTIKGVNSHKAESREYKGYFSKHPIPRTNSALLSEKGVSHISMFGGRYVRRDWE